MGDGSKRWGRNERVEGVSLEQRSGLIVSNRTVSTRIYFGIFPTNFVSFFDQKRVYYNTRHFYSVCLYKYVCVCVYIYLCERMNVCCSQASVFIVRSIRSIFFRKLRALTGKIFIIIIIFLIYDFFLFFCFYRSEMKEMSLHLRPTSRILSYNKISQFN